MIETVQVETNVLRSSMYLPLTVDEATYLRGAVKGYMRLLREGENKEFLRRILGRLEDDMLNIQSYSKQKF